MLHSFPRRLLLSRRLSLACALLAAGGAALWLPLRGAAQDSSARPPANQSNASDSSTDNAQNGYSDSGNAGSYTDNSGSSGNGNYGSSGNGGNSNGGNSNGGNSNGGSALGPNGQAAPNPPVGVDTVGGTDATATRNGRTTRRRLPPAPANPIVILNPTRGTGSTTLNPRGQGGTGTDRLAPPAPSDRPRNYEIPRDPASLGSRRYARPLPLFGYDFFQPARQIILARRRAFLPSAPRTNQRTTRPGNNTRQTNGSGTNSGNGNYPNGNGNGNYPNGSNGNGGNSSGNGGNSNNNGGYSDNNSGNGSYSNTGGSSNSNSSNNNDSNNNGSNGPNGTGGYSDMTGGGSDAGLAAGAVVGAAAVAGRADGNAYNPNNGSANNGYSDTGTAPDANQSGMGDSGNGYSGTGDNGYSGNSYGGTDTGGPYGSASGTDNGGLDANGNPTPRRRPALDATDPALNGGGFPGDTLTPNGDLQFLGDDALVQPGAAGGGGGNGNGGGASDAVSGQISDPIATLYRNALGSLPPNYQLQPGDSLTVRYSALTIAPREFSAVVDADGGLSLAGVGRISVAGRTSAQAEDALRQRLSRLYRDVDVSISLRQLRTIQVTLSGNAFAPGTYTVPATASAFNVLDAAGGPNPRGSLRDIRILRGGRLVGVLDIYPLIGATSSNPSARNGDVSLQPGDNIYIPARLSSVAVRGEVRQEAIYELKPTETLRDALSYAGGIKPSGVGQTVHIDTTRFGTGRILKDVSVSNRVQVASTRVYDGDTIEVASIRDILVNRVTAEGAVEEPGDYALTPGMRLLDLLQRARGPLYDAYLDRAELVRLNPDNTTRVSAVSIARVLDGDAAQNVPLVRFDRLRLYTRQEVAFLGRRQVTVRGAVQRPGLYTQSDNMRVSDLLLDTGGPLPDAYLNRAVLLHQRGDGTFAYDYVNLGSILAGNADDDREIADNDVLAVYKIGEAHFTPDHTVKVLGDVVAPGLYARGEGMRLTDLLKLAGAFKPGGGTRVTVAHARRPGTASATQVAPIIVAFNGQGASGLGTDQVLEDGDVVAVQGNGALKDHPAVVTVTGAVVRPGPILITSGTRLSDIVREAGGLRPEAFPEGAEFSRTSDSLLSGSQTTLAQVISSMSDMLNLSQYQRERAKANLALIEAAGTAASGSSGGLTIPGITPGASGSGNPNVAPLVQSLTQYNLVSQGRVLTPSQLQPNGAVAVRLVHALRHPGGTDDVLLKDGDTLVIPETPTTVQVVGAVYSPSGVVFRAGQSVGSYIQNAGGFTPDAATDRIEVIHAGGGLIPADKAGPIQPGDLILVPTKVLAEKVGRSQNGFSSFFQGLLGSAITLKVLSSVFGL